ncbi:hypothetical protein [Promicromonospora sp. NPDC023805]|uniref:hypothetical protein n=1 Tax=Promicromonospora sp. NPDC023805 TaxID=3154696 RepID=UPI0033D624F6
MTYPNPKVIPNPELHDRGDFLPDTSSCTTCHSGAALPVGQACQACGRDYRDFGAPAAYEPRIFDGPTTVIPDSVKVSLGFAAGSEVRAFDVTGIRLVVLVTDADVGNAHMGGAASTEERISILRQVLAGLEALQ